MLKLTIFFLLLILVNIFVLYAEAPELRNVMPNSWQKIIRLSAGEETRFLRENNALVNKSIQEYIGQAETSLTKSNKDILRTTKIYYEPVGEEKFYRLITINSATQDFTNQWELQFIQTLVYDFSGHMVILAIGGYNTSFTTESHGSFAIRTSLDIIRSEGRAKGILATRIASPVDWRGKRYTYFVKGQPWATNNSEYILINDLTAALNKNPNTPARLLERGVYLYDGVLSIKIDTGESWCLVDPNIPLRYSLQNAFDNDPATSYVENTEDDLMNIQVY